MSFSISIIEKELVEKCLKGDRTAQRELFYKYKDAMYTVLFRMLNDEDEASDALQEVFITVFKKLNTFRFKSSLGAWIKTITVRAGIDKHKKNQRFRFNSIQYLDDEPVIWPDHMTGKSLEWAIGKLSEGYRTIFLLIELEGYSHKEVAEMMGISVGTSKSQLHYAKKSLQSLLREFRYNQ